MEINLCDQEPTYNSSHDSFHVSREHDLIRMISVTHFEEKKYCVSSGIEQMAQNELIMNENLGINMHDTRSFAR